MKLQLRPKITARNLKDQPYLDMCAEQVMLAIEEAFEEESIIGKQSSILGAPRWTRVAIPPESRAWNSYNMRVDMTYKAEMVFNAIVYGRQYAMRACQNTHSNNWLRRHGMPMHRRK